MPQKRFANTDAYVFGYYPTKQPEPSSLRAPFIELTAFVHEIGSYEGGQNVLGRAAAADADLLDPAVQAEMRSKVAGAPRRPESEPQELRESCVYFIRCGEFVKIGTTTCGAQARFDGMQLPPNAELVAYMTGCGPMQEYALHTMFAAHRVKGEWFTSSPELEALIQRAANA